jgi:hypothetical protein
MIQIRQGIQASMGHGPRQINTLDKVRALSLTFDMHSSHSFQRKLNAFQLINLTGALKLNVLFLPSRIPWIPTRFLSVKPLATITSRVNDVLRRIPGTFSRLDANMKVRHLTVLLQSLLTITRRPKYLFHITEEFVCYWSKCLPFQKISSWLISLNGRFTVIRLVVVEQIDSFSCIV